MKVLISNIGCDDITNTEMELNEKELNFLIKFAKENNKNSGYRCQPSIEIYTDYTKDEDCYYSINYDSDLTKEEQLEIKVRRQSTIKKWQNCRNSEYKRL